MNSKSSNTVDDLLQIMARLRDPETGCPWDVEQDFKSIAPSTIEEAYEVVDAIENEDLIHLQDELGDLLFQVVFYAQLAREQKRFEFDDIVNSISDKLVRRHPHVFPDGTKESRVDPNNRPSEDFVMQQWEAIKKQERDNKGKTGLLSDIPSGLPGLLRAYKLQKRASTVGFDWPDSKGVLNKLDEEIEELKQAVESGDSKAIADEIGDCFFSLVNLCRHLKVDADSSLRAANRKFTQRFEGMESEAHSQDLELKQLNSEQLEQLWIKAKALTD